VWGTELNRGANKRNRRYANLNADDWARLGITLGMLNSDKVEDQNP
jgi:hypothetical protein